MSLQQIYFSGAVRDTTPFIVKTPVDTVATNYVFSGTAISTGVQAIVAFLASGANIPAVVQSRVLNNVSAAAFSSNVVAGNLLVAMLFNESSVAAVTVSDTVASTWTTALTVSGTVSVRIVYALAAASGANTVTFTGHSANHPNVAVIEISGAQAVLDGTPTGAAGAVTSPGNLTTTAVNSIALVGLGANANTSSWIAAAGWTLTQNNTSGTQHGAGLASLLVKPIETVQLNSRGGGGPIGRLRLWGQITESNTGGGSPNLPNWGSISATLPEGVLTIPYDWEFDMPLSASPVTYSVVAGALPAGLTLGGVGSTGVKITGTPTAAGTSLFTLRATNGYGSADQAFTLIVTAISSGGGGGGGSWAFLA
jgi:hypothetical protein